MISDNKLDFREHFKATSNKKKKSIGTLRKLQNKLPQTPLIRYTIVDIQIIYWNIS